MLKSRIFHHAGTVAAAILCMQCGNAVADAQPVRDLTIGQHQLIIGQKYPVKPAHWLKDELIGFLEEQRYPRIAYKDHERSRINSIRDALTHGEWIPMAVLSEEAGQEALEMAIVSVKAEHESLRKQQWHAENVARFELAIGYARSCQSYEISLNDLLIRACRQGKGQLINRLGGAPLWTVSLENSGVDGFPSLTLGRVVLRTGGLSESHLMIRDGELPALSLYGELMRIPMARAEDHLRRLIANESLTLAQCQLLMGPSWSPHVVIEKISSAA